LRIKSAESLEGESRGPEGDNSSSPQPGHIAWLRLPGQPSAEAENLGSGLASSSSLESAFPLSKVRGKGEGESPKGDSSGEPL